MDRYSPRILICILGVVTATAGVLAPVVQAAQARSRAERQPARQNGDQGNRSDTDKPDPLEMNVLQPGCQPDRVLRMPASAPLLRAVAAADLVTHVAHHPRRIEIARHAPSAEAVLDTAGPHRNHPPHAPPTRTA